MADAKATTYVPLHLLIDQDTEGNRHFVRILPPAPPVGTFRDAMFRLRVESKPEAVVDLIKRLDDTLSARQDLSEKSTTFKEIRQCGEWLDRCLREATDQQSPLRDCLRDCLHQHVMIKELGVLILLHFGEQAHDLAGLLWEAWKCEFGEDHPFLIMRDWVSLVRFVPGQRVPRDAER
ncbi:MAG TPA: hypothetical protein VKY89_15495, partial [Thermoanaerobaculia bacterium]|nr:hypothetical protein [Thermoanaerobaculia bacterium]